MFADDVFDSVRYYTSASVKDYVNISIKSILIT